MSSTQQPQDPTPAPEQPEENQPAEPTNANDAPGTTPNPAQTPPPEETGDEGEQDEGQGTDQEEQPQVVSGPLVVALEMMLFEAGMIANSLSSKSSGADLAAKLLAAEQEAEAQSQASLTFEFSVFEAGMALNAMSRSQDGTMDKLQELLHESLVDLMTKLGVQPLDNDQGGGTL